MSKPWSLHAKHRKTMDRKKIDTSLKMRGWVGRLVVGITLFTFKIVYVTRKAKFICINLNLVTVYPHLFIPK